MTDTEDAGYTTLDVQAGINWKQRTLWLMVWGKNVTNKLVVTNRNFTFDGVDQYVAATDLLAFTIVNSSRRETSRLCGGQ